MPFFVYFDACAAADSAAPRHAVPRLPLPLPLFYSAPRLHAYFTPLFVDIIAMIDASEDLRCFLIR